MLCQDALWQTSVRFVLKTQHEPRVAYDNRLMDGDVSQASMLLKPLAVTQELFALQSLTLSNLGAHL